MSEEDGQVPRRAVRRRGGTRDRGEEGHRRAPVERGIMEDKRWKMELSLSKGEREESQGNE